MTNTPTIRRATMALLVSLAVIVATMFLSTPDASSNNRLGPPPPLGDYSVLWQDNGSTYVNITGTSGPDGQRFGGLYEVLIPTRAELTGDLLGVTLSYADGTTNTIPEGSLLQGKKGARVLLGAGAHLSVGATQAENGFIVTSAEAIN